MVKILRKSACSIRHTYIVPLARLLYDHFVLSRGRATNLHVRVLAFVVGGSDYTGRRVTAGFVAVLLPARSETSISTSEF